MKFTLLVIRGLLYAVFYKIRYFLAVTGGKLTKGFTKVKITIQNISYFLLINLKEGGLSEDLYIFHIREYPNVLEYKKFIIDNRNSIQTYMDIGANIGFYAVYAQKIFNKFIKKNITCIAIEPIQETYTLLKQNLKLNSIFSYKTGNFAVGEKNKRINMFVAKQKNLCRVSQPNKHDTVESLESVQMKTLSTIFKEYKFTNKNILMRWDIEGYEYELVKGNQPFFKSLKNSQIIMEYHPFFLGVDKSCEFLHMLDLCGFSLTKVVSCEPLYFIKTPAFIRRILILLFLKQYNASELGLIRKYKTIDDVKKDLQIPDGALYHYPNLHLYLSKQ